MEVYNYSNSKIRIEQELNRVVDIETDTIPVKWKQYCEIFDFMDDRFIYFKNKPEEVLRLSFVGDSSNWNSETNCQLTLFDWFDGSKWVRNFDIKSEDKKRIVKRLETEILSKMRYSYRKEED